MTEKMFTELEKSISKNRLSTYRNFLNCNDSCKLIKTYILNAKISENFYFLLQNLEVTLRNAIYDNYTKNPYFKTPFFYLRESNTTKPFNREFHTYACWKMVGTVKYKLKKEGIVATDGKIIAELNFGFWTTLLEEKYYKTVIWRKIFKDVFPNYPHGKKIDDDVNSVFLVIDKIRLFRNRIFHFEAVIHKDNLTKIHKDILDVIYWLNLDIHKLTKVFDEFELIKENNKIIDRLIKKLTKSSKVPRKKLLRSKKKKQLDKKIFA